MFTNPLNAALERVAKQRDESISEIVRRATEIYLAHFPINPQKKWKYPEPVDCGGDFLMPPEDYNAEAEALEYKLLKK